MSLLDVAFRVVVLMVVVDRGLSASEDKDDITSEVFQDENLDMFPVAVGDYDSDRVMDTVFLSKNLSFFQIYFGWANPPFLRPRRGFSCDLGSSSKIVGLSLADFTGDGVLDILITVEEDSQNYKSVSVMKGSRDGLECHQSAIRMDLNGTVLRLNQEPLIVDLNGDMIADLVGELYGEEPSRKIWIFSKEGNVTMLDMWCGSLPCSPLSVPHISAFADLDGDFSPELIMVSQKKSSDPTSRQMEVFSISDEKPTFESFKNQPFDLGNMKLSHIGSLLLFDLEQRGKISPVMPFCDDPECNVSGLMINENGTFKVLNVNFTDTNGTKWGFMPPKLTPYDQAITLRVGDVNLDGFPDLIATLRPLNRDQIKSRAVIFYNSACNLKECQHAPKFTLNSEALSVYDDVVNAIFYDFQDNGLLDVMLVRKISDKLNSTASFKAQVILNRPKYDGYFLKLMMTSMHCQRRYCPPYGAVLPGASMNYTMLNREGNAQISKAAQFYRSAHFPVDLPFVIIGTGSTPNFIDTVWIGKSPSKHVVLVQKWRQIIPNSHLLVIPYTKGWELRHFLSTNEEGAWATLRALLLILFVNGIIVFVLWLKERKEDRRNVQMRGTLNFVRLT